MCLSGSIIKIPTFKKQTKLQNESAFCDCMVLSSIVDNNGSFSLSHFIGEERREARMDILFSFEFSALKYATIFLL